MPLNVMMSFVGLFLALLTVAVVRGIRRHEPALKILDDVGIGIVGLLICVAFLLPQLRIPAGIVSSLLFIRFLWTMPRRIRDIRNRSRSM
jgi:hypothetical protein